jgi:hypothetical protein
LFKISNTCHENIGKHICLEILHEENQFKFRTYLKILNTIDLSSAEYFTLKEFKKLAVEVTVVNKNLVFIFLPFGK